MKTRRWRRPTSKSRTIGTVSISIPLREGVQATTALLPNRHRRTSASRRAVSAAAASAGEVIVLAGSTLMVKATIIN